VQQAMAGAKRYEPEGKSSPLQAKISRQWTGKFIVDVSSEF